MAFILAVLAWLLWNSYQEQMRLALSGQLAVQAMSHMSDQPDLAGLLSIEALNTANSLEARVALITAAEQYPQLPEYLHSPEGSITSVAFRPDGRTLAAGMADNTIVLWDVAGGRPIGQPMQRHTDWVCSVAFSPDGKRLASGSKDKTIMLWDVAARHVIGKPLSAHTDWVYSVAFSLDGRMLASGSADNKCCDGIQQRANPSANPSVDKPDMFSA